MLCSNFTNLTFGDGVGDDDDRLVSHHGTGSVDIEDSVFENPCAKNNLDLRRT